MEEPKSNPDAFISASALPMLKDCPCFTSGEAGYAAQRGTLQHAFIEAHLKGQKPLIRLLSKEREAADWAIEWIRKNTSENRCSELKLGAKEGYPMMKRGIMDVIDWSGDSVHVVDYKSGSKHDYSPQMAYYAILAIQNSRRVQNVKISVVYGKVQESESYGFTMESAKAIVDPIVSNVMNPEKQPSKCSYCGWCAKSDCPFK